MAKKNKPTKNPRGAMAVKLTEKSEPIFLEFDGDYSEFLALSKLQARSATRQAALILRESMRDPVLRARFFPIAREVVASG